MFTVDNARIMVVFAMAGAAIFWRQVLRVLLAIVLIAACVGVLVILQSMHL